MGPVAIPARKVHTALKYQRGEMAANTPGEERRKREQHLQRQHHERLCTVKYVDKDTGLENHVEEKTQGESATERGHWLCFLGGKAAGLKSGQISRKRAPAGAGAGGKRPHGLMKRCSWVGVPVRKQLGLN